MSLENKIVLVACRKSVAMISVIKMLLHEKATLIVIAKSATDLAFIKDIKTTNAPAKLVTILVDYSDYYKAVEIVDQITEVFGRIDACIFYFETPTIRFHLLETAITDWENMVELNISAYYVAVRSVFAAMKVFRRGLFITIHEELTYHNYSPSQLAQLSECIHKEMACMFFEELGDYGIGFYHLLVAKSVNAENAGPFVHDLFGKVTANRSDLFLSIPRGK